MRASSMGVLGALLTAAVLVATVAAGQANAPEPAPPPLPAPADSAQPTPSPPSPPLPPQAAPPAASAPAPPSSATSTPPPPPESEPPSPPLLKKHAHDGFYLGIGSGVGPFAAWGDGPFGSASISGLGMRSSVAVGGSPMPGLAIVVALDSAGLASPGTFNGGTQVVATSKMVVNGQTTTNSGTLTGHSTARMFLFGAGVDWYPIPEGGWHAGAAVGLGGLSIVDDGGNTMGGISVGASLFGGYQFWLGGSWSLGISGFFTGAPSMKLNDSSQNDLGYRMMPLSGGIQSLLLYY